MSLCVCVCVQVGAAGLQCATPVDDRCSSGDGAWNSENQPSLYGGSGSR